MTSPSRKFQISHFQVTVADLPETGQTVALHTGGVDGNPSGPALFSGHISDGMSMELAELAKAIRPMEPRFRKG